MNWFKSLWKAATAPSAREWHDPIFNNFTPRAQQVLKLSVAEAKRFKHSFVGTEHVLLGLISLGQGTAVAVLRKIGIQLEAVRQEIEQQVQNSVNELL